MKDSSVHVLDYNPALLATTNCRRISYLKNIYAMRQIWFKTLLGALTVTSLSVAMFLSLMPARAYQGVSTPTGIFVTVTYTDPINVRSGPSTLVYPVVGRLNPGDIVPALGVSPGHDWIEISFSGGTGWVYASPVYISVSGGELQVVEPPPTPPPPSTYTIDPTLAAAFNTQPTPTRMPTFTPPPPLVVPRFTEENARRASGPTGVFILSLGSIGAIGLLISYVLRK
jgi:uncharacterized protein YraI